MKNMKLGKPFVNLNQLCYKYRAMENFILKTGIAMQSMLTCGKLLLFRLRPSLCTCINLPKVSENKRNL